VSAALNQARLDLREAENSRDALRKQVIDDEPSLIPDRAGTDAAISTPQLDARIAALRSNVDTLLLRFTEEHPDVISSRRLIASLEEQKRQEIAARTRAAAANPQRAASAPGGNPFAQQLKIAQAEADANVASLQTRVAEYEARYARLKDAAKRVPQIEAEFTQLNRDYGIHKRNYETLVQRRESVEISGEMQSTAGIADFRLIDPPRVSSKPVAPNRLLLFPMALLAALAAGLFTSFAVSQVWPSFFDSRSLRDATGVPVLGSVTMIPNAAMKRKERRGLVGFISGFVALLGSFGAGLLALFLLSSRAV
jgi:polysaccharide chain length determinant protein (PEP-CTERM system associated)